MKPVKGAGLGLRGPFLKDISEGRFSADWFEVTPENWVKMPRAYREDFFRVADKFPLAAHGVGLSLGSPETENHHFLEKIKSFLDEFKITSYSEHLSFSSFMGRQSYELLPVPMTMKMAEFISEKIKRISDLLKRPIIVENISWYYMPYSEMEEADFINTILEKSGAPLLLDFVLEKIRVPVMIERDNNIPPLEEIKREYRALEKILKRTELPDGAMA